MTGQLFSLVKLPPLLGMLTLGIICRNVPYYWVEFGNVLNSDVSSILRYREFKISKRANGSMNWFY
jgi:hypothetical protein